MPKLTHIRLVRLHYVPKALEPGLLYVAEEFGAAVHLCACGCGTKVSTPLGPTEWSLQESTKGPSLRPSVGNWQHPCQAHYWINRGEIIWSSHWTSEQIEAGRRAEQQRRRAYHDELEHKREGFWKPVWRWIKRLFGYTA